jgi:hypothetical protein
LEATPPLAQPKQTMSYYLVQSRERDLPDGKETIKIIGKGYEYESESRKAAFRFTNYCVEIELPGTNSATCPDFAVEVNLPTETIKMAVLRYLSEMTRRTPNKEELEYFNQVQAILNSSGEFQSYLAKLKEGAE